MASRAFFRLDVQLNDVVRQRHGRRVLQFAPRHNETSIQTALKLIAACSLEGERCTVPSSAPSVNMPDVAHLDAKGHVCRWVCVDPQDSTAVRRARGCSDRVSVLFSNPTLALKWWRKHRALFHRVEAPDVLAVSFGGIAQIESRLKPRMQWQCTLDGNAVAVCVDSEMIDIEWLDVRVLSEMPNSSVLSAG